MVEDSEQLFIVVGANLRAEISDRPLAYGLCERIRHWQGLLAEHATAEPVTAIELASIIVCTDLWYLNSKDLMVRPAISIGDPGVNAATAYLANRLPTAMVIEGRSRMHLDPEFIDPQACIWGVDSRATAEAIDVFAERYLDEFLHAAMNA